MDFEQEKRRRDVEYAIAGCDQSLLTGEWGKMAEDYILGRISLEQWGKSMMEAMA